MAFISNSLGRELLRYCYSFYSEVVGGSMEMREDELPLNYQTFCDPRLNYEQSLDIAFMIAGHFNNEKAENEKS
jgi:3-deoxy-7-phosphoheptulonate synthase